MRECGKKNKHAYPAKLAHVFLTLVKEIEDAVTAPSFDKVIALRAICSVSLCAIP
jgi:hypothetical protein